MAYACQQARAIAGVLLLAPFLGLRGGDRRPEHLAALERRRAEGGTLPTMFLGYGRQDRYAAASAQLAHLLPAGHTVTIDGGHDWATWTTLWDLLLKPAFDR